MFQYAINDPYTRAIQPFSPFATLPQYNCYPTNLGNAHPMMVPNPAFSPITDPRIAAAGLWPLTPFGQPAWTNPFVRTLPNPAFMGAPQVIAPSSVGQHVYGNPVIGQPCYPVYGNVFNPSVLNPSVVGQPFVG